MCSYRGKRIGKINYNTCGCNKEEEILKIPIYKCELFNKCTKVLVDLKTHMSCTKCPFRTVNSTQKDTV